MFRTGRDQTSRSPDDAHSTGGTQAWLQQFHATGGVPFYESRPLHRSAISRKAAIGVPFDLKGLVFWYQSRDPLVLVVLSRMTFGISNYEHLIDAGLSNMCSFVCGPAVLRACATQSIYNRGWSNRKVGLNG
jgi:hypothetical protein